MAQPYSSIWPNRGSVCLLALAGCAIATYLTLYQWGVSSGVWDGVFGSASSKAVLDSSLSKALPVPDATLGAIAYAFEAVLAFAGGAERWRESPWLVLLYGLVAAALAVTALLLVLSQAFIVGSGCALCLVSASISLVNAWLAHAEVLATLRLLVSARSQHRPLWRVMAGSH